MGERLTRAQQQQRTRQRLLDAAESLFAERGIHQTSLDEVAAEAGLTKGAIYANFDGKTGLLRAILERRRTDARAADTNPATSTVGWLSHLGDTYELALAQPETRRFAMALVEFWLYGMRTPAARADMAHWLRTVRDGNAREITDRSGSDPPIPVEQLATLMTALDIGIAFQHLIDPEGVPGDLYARGLAAILGRSGTVGGDTPRTD
ncbi:TetR/AcrR family transcriptional regulator [Micromonospora endolithica]|uniref:TetR/AcrR family transcriptional regulator n=1 Tax=Micromonospora endolithica TaxID=230091 RepID=A0A3A9ZDP3_9ACTN|nr:TetR/AcrR family transcriptional regulator [Micromonospora endolithica]RKN45427.1 TetR/AcrR family transcriptional regulator [Micromonospora endolithica]TWJ22851.1 TetR family transcriptional regulator [Micromonospora endolithica]